MSDKLRTYLLTECVPVLSDANIEQIQTIVLEESEEVEVLRSLINIYDNDTSESRMIHLHDKFNNAKHLLTKYEKK